MAAFSELDWTKFDVMSIVSNAGIGVVDAPLRSACHGWLKRHNYSLESVDFNGGLSAAVVALGKLLKWEEQFGYALAPESRNLDALRDGFDFNLQPGDGTVIELVNADKAFHEDARWFQGLLSIASEYSRSELALGNRFFVVLILEKGSKLEGVQFNWQTIPTAFRSPKKDATPFED